MPKIVESGDALLARLTNSAPPALQPLVREFERAHAEYRRVAAAVEQARLEADAATHDVGECEAELEQAVMVLADRMAAAGYGAASNPFRGFSALTPRKLLALPWD